MKKFAIILICFFSLFCLSGCDSNQVEISKDFIMLSLQQNNDGSTKQSLFFSVNSEYLRENSKNIQEELNFKQNLIKNVDNLRNEFLFSFALIYMNNPQEEYKINQGVLLSQVGYDSQSDCVGFEITFTSREAWQFYHPSSSKGEDKPNSNIFYQKVESEGIFPFATKVQNADLTLGEKYKQCYLSSAQNLSFEIEYNPQFIYNYSTTYNKYHSNADLQFKGNDKKYHHVWVENDLNDCKNIQIYLYIINKGWWILFGLTLPLIVMSICIIYHKRKRRKDQYDVL